MAGSIFEPHPPNFGKSDIFWRSTNDVTIIFGNFHFYKSWKKCTQARRPGVEESLDQSMLEIVRYILIMAQNIPIDMVLILKGLRQTLDCTTNSWFILKAISFIIRFQISCQQLQNVIHKLEWMIFCNYQLQTWNLILDDRLIRSFDVNRLCLDILTLDNLFRLI